MCVTEGLELVPKILITDIDQCANLRGEREASQPFF